MRIHITTTPALSPVPYGYMPHLVGRLHKWLGYNELHDDLSLYSLSSLIGGKGLKDGIIFPRGASFFMSFYNEETAKNLVQAIMNDRRIFDKIDMEIMEVRIQLPPEPKSGEFLFHAESPILVKKQIDVEKDGVKKAETRHLIYSDPEADEILTKTLHTKLKKAGLAPTGKVTFDRNYKGAKTKLIDYKGIKNRGSICPVLVEGPPEVIQFAWNVGIGHSTGAGFGALR